MEETVTRINQALAQEEARAEFLANRIRLILFVIFTFIALANAPVVDTSTNIVNFGALLLGYTYGITVFLTVRRGSYRPFMKYVTSFLDVLVVHCVLFAYTLMDTPSVALKNYVFMIVFPVIALTLFCYDPRFTWLTGSFAILLYLCLFFYLFEINAIRLGANYSSELFSTDVTLVSQLTKVLILFAFVVIASYLARYTRVLLVTLVSNETKVRVAKDVIDRELQLASQVQLQLLPKVYPMVEGLAMYGTALPGKYVSGDYFDFVKLSEHSLLLVIADVSGHGVPAALIMAEVRASIHVLIPSSKSLIDVANRLNTLLFHSTARKDYVTFFLAEIDTRANRICYLNAGHPPPLVGVRGRIAPLPGRTLGLGLVTRLPKLRVNVSQFALNSTLVCYTDGITERMNAHGEQFGERRLHDYVQTHPELDVADFAHRLLAQVRDFAPGKELEDDATLAIVRRM